MSCLKPLVAFITIVISPSAFAAPKELPSLFMPQEMYPPAALAAGLEGQVKVTLKAGPDGKIRDCVAESAEALVLLKRASCEILSRRITFSADPASVKSTTVLAQWNIPSDLTGRNTGGAIAISPNYWVFNDDFPTSELGNTGRTTVAFVISATGRASDCKVENSSGSQAFDRRTCDVILARARFVPAIDDAGAPRPTTGRWTILWRA